nr:putative protein [uncultured bacterium]
MIICPNILQTLNPDIKNYAAKHSNRAGRNIAHRQHGLRCPRYENHGLNEQAIALAAGASDVIGNAQIVDTLDEALAGCSLVVGTSARSRTLPWPMLDPRECGLKSVSEAEQAPVASKTN